MKLKHLSAAATLIGNRLRPHEASRRVSTVSTTVVLAVLLVVTSACGATTGATAKITTLKIAINSAPNSLDPALASGSRQFIALPLSLSYAALFHETPAGKIEPQLATSWRYDNSGAKKNQVFEFTLRRGVKFSDGIPVTAQSVVGWLQYFVKTKGIFAGTFGVKPIFTATGALTVKIQMTSPNPALPLILSDEGNNAGYVASPKAVANPSLMKSASYGAGQYQMQTSQSVNGDHYTYVPNPYYYDKPAIRFKQVYVKVISNPSSRLQAQQSGQYQVSLGDATTAMAARSAGLQVQSAPQGMFFLSLDLIHDVGAPELRNVKVRQAMNYAIDRVAIAKGLFGATGVPKWGFVTADAKADSADFHYDYDVAKAKKLLAQAGYAKGFSLNLVCSGYFGNYGQPLMNAVAQDLKAVGIDLKITSLPDQASFATYALKYQTALIQTLDQFDVTTATYPLYLSAASPIAFFGGDKKIDRLYALGASSSDPGKYWNEMWRRYTSQAYAVPLVEFPNFFFVSKGIGGVEVNSRYNTSLPTAWYPTGK
ncbi:ABC transporter substrate-binding protein [Streptomyces brasiliensis]|uniref:ABC transporter substrate-binding protein n=1 Tax=Streptomyces brasiliensis TaxID=1954 RepID=A0A917PD63_9ACTN|nr:ABC transporter substrate-binding protein [Streptomyces brasiliensis]GGJ71280.1 ABC transporter substrate-binding protein [Streptomyces brasiliensis]